MTTNNVGRVIISLIVVLGFMAMTWMFVSQKMAGGTPGETLTLLVGALATNFSNVVGYWIGSSSGSTAKDEQLSKTADKLAEKVPASPSSPAAAVAAAAAAAPAAAAKAAPPAAAVAAPPAAEAAVETALAERGIDTQKGP